MLVFSGWLDDIGLPQYKGVFYENRVDGRILQNMTLVSFQRCLSLSYLFFSSTCKRSKGNYGQTDEDLFVNWFISINSVVENHIMLFYETVIVC